MRVLVCGGRDYCDCDWLFRELDAIKRARGVTVIISGCAPGADTLGIEWAEARGALSRYQRSVAVIVAGARRHDRISRSFAPVHSALVKRAGDVRLTRPPR